MSKKELPMIAIDDFLIALNQVNEKLERLERFREVIQMSNSEIIKYLSIIKNLCSLTSEQIDRLQESLNI